MRLAISALFLCTLLLTACEPKEEITVATPDSTVIVAYEGTLPDGTVFDSNDRARLPLPNMIPGFQTNITGMTVGETKTFEVPPEEGYGDRPPPSIPPNTNLTFEVTLLDIVE
ncbi:MAG: FKBP-type peptidyl-prolyl cis-trans isomerase [Bacteroidota bacterium]